MEENVTCNDGGDSSSELNTLSESLPPVLEEIDQLIESKNEWNESEVPKSVEILLKAVDSMVSNYEKKNHPPRFGFSQADDTLFFDSLDRISRLEKMNASTDASVIIQRAMALLEEEFRSILEPSRMSESPERSDYGSTNENGEYPYFSEETVKLLKKISSAMIESGYEKECCIIYSTFRRISFNDELMNELGFENISFDEVEKSDWETLEGDIVAWINAFKHCYTVLFTVERNLANTIYSDHQTIAQKLFTDLAAAVVVRFLNFGEAVFMTKRSAEKLFKFLDMYETVRDVIPHIDNLDLFSPDRRDQLVEDVNEAKSRIGEAAAVIFLELENAIRTDQGRTPVPSGQVHPLTRYTMNYLKYTVEYKETLKQIFKHLEESEAAKQGNNNGGENSISVSSPMSGDDGEGEKSAFSTRLISVMDLLDANLEAKSKLYRDPALRCIFLMNNGRYILQKVKSTNEMRELMGANWCRVKSTNLRLYHKNYQRETWSRLLQCMSPEGLMANGKVVKPLLKERFKTFNSMFEEIHRAQSTWVVSDEQMQSELRVSISAVVIPAYRSFLGRFRQHLEMSRQSEKYIKYQPEDVETMIEELFDANPVSMQKRKN